MNKYGLVGKGISYSLSPKLHYIISNIYNLEYKYNLYDVDESLLTKVLGSNKLRGVNITKPYKELLYSKVDCLSNIAKKIGAINTIKIKEQKLYGENTDYYGLIDLIEYHDIKLKDKSIIILGTGGAALASYYAVLNYTNKIYFVSRNKKEKIMPDIVIDYKELSNMEYDLIINATPVGTYPDVNVSPLDEDLVKNKIVIDLVYNPLKTQLMSYSSESYNGIVMLISQAIHSQSFWHNKKLEINNDIINEIKELLLSE